MKKILFLHIVLLFVCGICFSQDSIRLKIQSQYETPLRKTKVIDLNTGKTFITDDEGRVIIYGNVNDSIKVESEVYNSSAVSLNKAKNNIIKINKTFSWKDLITPMFYIINGGLWLILFIVFAETGLFAGFFLPGDSLLFVAGIYNRELVQTVFPFIENDIAQLMMMWLLISICGIIGNSVGYWFGNKVGHQMYHWKDNLLFKKKYLHQAHEFYEKHGGGAIIISRFLPIIRTFAPIVAGIVEMDKKKFMFFNIIGCLPWVFSMLFAGHFLQKWILIQFNFDLKSHLEVIVLGIVLVTTAPVIIKLLFSKKKEQPQ
jgi:membrane-associated protein